MKVLVCGSRSWQRPEIIEERLRRLPRGTTIISGGARGADQMAETIARRLGFFVDVFLPDWLHQGRSAGFKRNLEMLDQEPDLVIAFWDGESTGTAHTLKNALERKIPVEPYDEDGLLIRVQQLWSLIP